jgi:hypothetical protein
VRILTSSTNICMGLLTTATSVHAWGKPTVPLLEYRNNINYLLSLLQYGDRNVQIRRGIWGKI